MLQSFFDQPFIDAECASDNVCSGCSFGLIDESVDARQCALFEIELNSVFSI